MHQHAEAAILDDIIIMLPWSRIARHQCSHIYWIRDPISALNPIHPVIHCLYLRHTQTLSTEIEWAVERSNAQTEIHSDSNDT